MLSKTVVLSLSSFTHIVYMREGDVLDELGRITSQDSLLIGDESFEVMRAVL